jgi:hypothetical protein
MGSPLPVILARPRPEQSRFVTHPFFSSRLADRKECKNLTAVGTTALVEATDRVPASILQKGCGSWCDEAPADPPARGDCWKMGEIALKSEVFINRF